MPEIIDNVKVGEYIKNLLKKHQMTQDQLATKLNISKSAVSQNLRGKSTFDIQNMIRIAEIFNITLDDLLSLKSSENPDVLSEYQRVVQQGLEVFKKTKAENLRIDQPDMYGKVLVDYIIEAKHIEMFKYLNDYKVSFVEMHYHRALTIYLEIIIFMLEQNIQGAFYYIEKYKTLNQTFVIKDQIYKLKIWGLLNQEKYQNIVEEIFNDNIKEKPLKIFFSKPQDPGYLSKTDMIDIIASYKLDNILKTYLKTVYKDTQYLHITKQFVKHKYILGIQLYIDLMFNKPLTWIKKATIEVQQGILEVVKLKDEKLILDFVEKGLYTDLTEIVLLAVKHHLMTVVNYLIVNYSKDINYRQVGEACIDANNKLLFDDIKKHLSDNDLNYLLSYTNKDDLHMMIYLIENGATIDEKYFNLTTFKKMNTLLKYLINKGEEA